MPAQYVFRTARENTKFNGTEFVENSSSTLHPSVKAKLRGKS